VGLRPSTPVVAGRTLSAIELAIGIFVVVGHNVFHVVPNEVPILFILGIASIRLREGSFAAVGFRRPRTWWKLVLLALVIAIGIVAMGELVTEPLAKAIGLHRNPGAATGALGHLRGNLWAAMKALGVVWTFAAFGEEIGYRRYLIGRGADLGGRSTVAYWAALLLVSALFGVGHYYQGPAGVFTTACDGVAIGAAYLLSGRNLWVAVLSHGLVDTIAIVLLFFGLAN
jgi:membrane protease YdiL (CAAX protease family)